jgi:hypothetical protein
VNQKDTRFAGVSPSCWYIAGENRWRILGESHWCSIGENRWYIFGENLWYNMGENAWYIIGRKMTIVLYDMLTNKRPFFIEVDDYKKYCHDHQAAA